MPPREVDPGTKHIRVKNRSNYVLLLVTVSSAILGWFIFKLQASLCIPEVEPLPVNMTTSSFPALTHRLIIDL